MGWLTKKNNVASFTAKDVHAEIGIKTLSFVQSISEFEEYKNLLFELENKKSLLELADMKKSENYRAILEIEDKIKSVDDCIKIKKAMSDIGFTSPRIMWLKDLLSIFQKYDLYLGCLDDYTGKIPDRNAEDIINAKQLVSNFDVNRFQKIESIFGDEKLSNSEKILIQKAPFTTPSRRNTFLDDDDLRRLPLIDGFINLSNAQFSGDFGFHKLIIAAPRKDISTTVRFRQSVEYKPSNVDDPIVFSVSGRIAVVHTAWGDEGKDVYDIFK